MNKTETMGPGLLTLLALREARLFGRSENSSDLRALSHAKRNQQVPSARQSANHNTPAALLTVALRDHSGRYSAQSDRAAKAKTETKCYNSSALI
ncbi:hypothetical protein AAFF_G00217210 [Aldrovandia affinis]|uniref:Uncharacterized protein n=1 Tax=Aldrovandia affinis TaxID=143900 RepID=A0AAD7WUF4_9TELE|nr:hypothetical protein AAFF_G00217210 [Aldrovandia affinis]